MEKAAPGSAEEEEAGALTAQPGILHPPAAAPFLIPLILSGDQAPAAASAEAAERGEEEQIPDQHRGHSGPGGDEG